MIVQWFLSPRPIDKRKQVSLTDKMIHVTSRSGISSLDELLLLLVVAIVLCHTTVVMVLVLVLTNTTFLGFSYSWQIFILNLVIVSLYNEC